jgi:hypothetical protein
MRTIPGAVTPSQMPVTAKSQALSMAYVYAIAAKAGAGIYLPKDDFGVDMAFSKITRRLNGRRTDTKSVIIPFQVKSSKDWKLRADVVIYDLESKNYNDLIDSTLCVLILMCLPPTFDEWLYQDEECLRLHKCCYYWQPSDRIETPNDHTARIIIPRSQIFTADALTALLDQAQSRLQL